MTEIAKTYLGNLQENVALGEKLKANQEVCLEVNLSQSDRRKGRIHTQSTAGIAVGIIKSRDWLLREGDVLETEQGKLLLVHLQSQELMVLSFTPSVAHNPIELIHLGHVLGNHHYPIVVKDNKIYLQLIVDKEIMETTIRNFQIPGLQINYEEQLDGDRFISSEHHHHF